MLIVVVFSLLITWRWGRACTTSNGFQDFVLFRHTGRWQIIEIVEIFCYQCCILIPGESRIYVRHEKIGLSIPRPDTNNTTGSFETFTSGQAEAHSIILCAVTCFKGSYSLLVIWTGSIGICIGIVIQSSCITSVTFTATWNMEKMSIFCKLLN